MNISQPLRHTESMDQWLRGGDAQYRQLQR